MSDETQQTATNVMEQIVSLAKRRGFIYQASEIYGGIRGFWDYGPLGVLLKNNIRDWWWQQMVLSPPIGPDGHPVDMVGLDSSIIQHPKTWKASGHVDTFTDPGMWNASAPASILAMGITPGDGIDSPSWR